MSQVITNAFEQYWQSCLAAEKPVVLDEFILADIPNLDITSPIDPETGLPPESQIVHRQNVDQRGRINNNAVAYTIVMDTTVGDFSFNAMYLRNKQNGVIGMIVYKGRETKLKTDQTTGQTGNSLVKSMLMGYDQAAEATLTHVDAGTWQIDYAARLRGMDEDIRQLQADLYGHHTFVGDGFKVVEKDGDYQVSQGVAIIGGLRVELKAPEVIHPGTKPIGVWVDVHRAGSLLSEHQNHFTIITSVADLADHVDSNGYQHYVAKLGTVQEDGSLYDNRIESVDGAISDTSTNAREALRRSLAESGYNLMPYPNSFEDGGILNKERDALLHKKSGRAFIYKGSLPRIIENGESPYGEGWVCVSDIYVATVQSIDDAVNMDADIGSLIRIYDRDNALFIVEGGVSKYPLVNAYLRDGVYLSLQAENGCVTAKAAGVTNYDDTQIFNELMLLAKDLGVSVNVNCKMTMRSPLDEHTFIRLPENFSVYCDNPWGTPVTIRPQKGVVRDAGLCLNSFRGLRGPQPDMCSGTVCRDIYITKNSDDGGIVNVGHCIVGAMFRTSFIRPHASGFDRHNILLCRAWYCTIQGLFGRAGAGSGVTIGKHPDVNQAWDGAVNGVEIDEVWGHGAGGGKTWVATDSEDIGYGVGLYGQMFSVHIGKAICELNYGAGFQNKLSYGDVKIDSMYLEGNASKYDLYSAIKDSSGISWQFYGVYLATGAGVKINHDANTSGSVIEVTFATGNNTYDVSGVSGANVKLARSSVYDARNKIGKALSSDYKVLAKADGNLNSLSVDCKGSNSVNSLEFDNNVELVFVPYVTTTSPDQYVFQIMENGDNKGTTLGKSGPFVAYKPVIFASWSGRYDSFYTFKPLDAYAESCPGQFIIRARHL